MEKYIATIQLQDAETPDYELLKNYLNKKSFKVKEAFRGIKRSEAVAPARTEFSKHGTLQHIVTDVMAAARKTGKQFSFTVIRHKAS